MPGLQRGVQTQKVESVKPLKKMVGRQGELALRPKPVRTIQLPVWAISVAVISAFFIGVMTTVLFQDELDLRSLR